ncbi:MAG: hypothetical protein E7387_06065 [Ruminococcaceae bacterium]|nr:hypothetical protein [Oscillospiraceae bacterium]
MEEKKEIMQQSKKAKNNLLIPFIVVLIGSVMLIVTLFLPFASATEEYAEHLQKYSDEMYAVGIDMKNEEAIDISLLEFIKVYAATADLGMSQDVAVVCLVIIFAFILFAILTVLFSVFKKPIPAIIFNLLSFGVFWVIRWDFEDRGVIPSSNYDWGIAGTFCYVGIVVVMIGAVALLVMKIMTKKQRQLVGQQGEKKI